MKCKIWKEFTSTNDWSLWQLISEKLTEAKSTERTLLYCSMANEMADVTIQCRINPRTDSQRSKETRTAVSQEGMCLSLQHQSKENKRKNTKQCLKSKGTRWTTFIQSNLKYIVFYSCISPALFLTHTDKERGWTRSCTWTCMGIAKEKFLCGTEMRFQRQLTDRIVFRGKIRKTCKLYPFTHLHSSLSKAALILTCKKTSYITQSLLY